MASVPRNALIRGLELGVDVLGPADEPHAGQAEPVGAQALGGGRDDVRVVGQPEVVVGAQVDDPPAVGVHPRALGRGDHPFALVQPLLGDLGELATDMVEEGGVHGEPSCCIAAVPAALARAQVAGGRSGAVPASVAGRHNRRPRSQSATVPVGLGCWIAVRLVAWIWRGGAAAGRVVVLLGSSGDVARSSGHGRGRRRSASSSPPARSARPRSSWPTASPAARR